VVTPAACVPGDQSAGFIGSRRVQQYSHPGGQALIKQEPGLAERALATSIVLWIGALAVTLIRISEGSRTQPPANLPRCPPSPVRTHKVCCYHLHGG
jgi:hypothetical protein